MYNRYIPQPDGSYQCRRVEPRRPPPKPPQEPPCPPPQPEPCPPPPCHQPPEKTCKRPQSAGGFFQNLLPKDMDTGDLIVVLLLLLMAGDCEENRTNALLTLVLYLFM